MISVTSVEALVDSVEALSHRSRCAALVELGRRLVVDSAAPDLLTLPTVIAELGDAGQVHYYRLLAAYLLCGAFAETQRRHQAMPAALHAVARSLVRDPTLKVAQLLMTPVLIKDSTAGDRPDDTVVSQFLRETSLPQFKRLSAVLVRAKRHDLLQHLYKTRTVTDQAKVQVLLGSLLPAALEEMSLDELAALESSAIRRLCQYHPEWIAQHLSSRVRQAVSANGTVDEALRSVVEKALVYLPKHGAAKHGLTLLTSTAHLLKIPECTLCPMLEQHYLSVYPLEVGTYLLDGEGSGLLASLWESLRCTLPRRAWKRMNAHVDLVLRLMDKQVLRYVGYTLSRVSAGARAAYFARGISQTEDDYRVRDVSFVALVPTAAARTAAALRCFRHKRLRDSPRRRVEYLELLPFPQAVKVGVAFVTSNNADYRCDFIRVSITSLRYFPEHVQAALEFCVQRTNEQDPWRTAMFGAWAELPHKFWRKAATHVPDAAMERDIKQLMQAALRAADVSYSTHYAMEKLLCRLVVTHTDFAVTELTARIRERKEFASGVRWRGSPFTHAALLKPSALAVLATALLPLAMELLHPETQSVTFKILSSLLESQEVGNVLLRSAVNPGEPPMAVLVRDTLRRGLPSTDRDVASTFFKYYKRYFSEEVVAHLPHLIAENKDWIVQDEVQTLVCDVLQGPLLSMLVAPIPDVPHGRFNYDEEDAIVPLQKLSMKETYRWTARQQLCYAHSCLEAIHTPDAVHCFDLRFFIMALARLPSVDSKTSWTGPDGVEHSLITLSRDPLKPDDLDSMRMALQALGQMDGDAAAVAALQRALDVDDLRMQALRSMSVMLLRLPSVEMVRLLNPLLTGKRVTPQKESLYLIAARRDDVAYARLVQFAAERQLPMPPVDHEESGGSHSTVEQPTSAQLPSATTLPMHRDVRTALVSSLFQFLDKPQVWLYYTSLVVQEYVAVQNPSSLSNDEKNAEGAGEGAGSDSAESDGAESDSVESDSGDDAEGSTAAATSVTSSTPACVAMTGISWSQLRMPWQVSEYQTLLRRLLRHPNRKVHVEALRKLRTVPPYEDLALCEAAAACVAEEDDASDLQQCALRCMLSCTAGETIAVIITTILAIEEDTTLETVIDGFCGLRESTTAAERVRFNTVVAALARQLSQARRLPKSIVSLIYALELSELVPRLMAMERAGLLHPGAAVAAIAAVDEFCPVLHDIDAAAALERATLCTHPSALLRRLGLAILLYVCEKSGWDEERKEALAAYRRDSDLWVSSDARLARAP
ncbi:ARM-like helical domain-containing protein [Novymonas esmeraldas]|uniref:ARM-like helical domain-containing protein n=1 Tax=Novymonas esmeraldas TaxID=1808958 RepID=A0AAW0EQ62_9TRYP